MTEYANIDAALPVLKATTKKYGLTLVEASAAIQAANALSFTLSA